MTAIATDTLGLEQRRGAYHLLHVWAQYSSDHNVRRAPNEPNGFPGTVLAIAHWNMGAGEDATIWLESLGLVEDNGHEAVLTPAGIALMEGDEP